MKTLSDIKADASKLYDDIRNGSVDLKVAAEMNNTAGKFLKADALEFAKEVYLRGQAPQLPSRGEPPLIGEST